MSSRHHESRSRSPILSALEQSRRERRTRRNKARRIRKSKMACSPTAHETTSFVPEPKSMVPEPIDVAPRVLRRTTTVTEYIVDPSNDRQDNPTSSREQSRSSRIHEASPRRNSDRQQRSRSPLVSDRRRRRSPERSIHRSLEIRSHQQRVLRHGQTLDLKNPSERTIKRLRRTQTYRDKCKNKDEAQARMSTLRAMSKDEKRTEFRHRLERRATKNMHKSMMKQDPDKGILSRHVLPAAPSPPSWSDLVRSSAASAPKLPRMSLEELAAQSLAVLGGRPSVKTVSPTLLNPSISSVHEDYKMIDEGVSLAVTDVWLPPKIEVTTDDQPVTSTQTDQSSAPAEPVANLLRAFLKQEADCVKPEQQSTALLTTEHNCTKQTAPTRQVDYKSRHQPLPSPVSRSIAAPLPLNSLPQLSLINGRVLPVQRPIVKSAKWRNPDSQASIARGKRRMKMFIAKKEAEKAALAAVDVGSGSTVHVISANPDALSALHQQEEITSVVDSHPPTALSHDSDLEPGEIVDDPPTCDQATTSQSGAVTMSPKSPALTHVAPVIVGTPPSTTSAGQPAMRQIGRMLDDGFTTEQLIEYLQNIGSSAKDIVMAMEMAMSRKADTERAEREATKKQHLATVMGLLRDTSSLLPSKN